MGMKRSKSGLLPLVEVAKAKEPETGPGSATCFCRVQDRRARAEEARLALRGRTAGQNVGQDGPKFHDINLIDLGDLAALNEALRVTMQAGKQYRTRVAAL